MNAPNDGPSPPASPGYAMPDHSYTAPRVRHTSHVRFFVIFAISLAVVIGAVIGVRALVVKPVAPPQCPQECVGPPKGPPGGVLPGVGPGPPVPTGLPHPPPGAAPGPAARTHVADAQPASAITQQPTPQAAVQPVQSFLPFDASDGSFSFSYPDGATKNPNGVSWTDTSSGDSAQIFGIAADNVTPREIAQQLIQARWPNARSSYQLPIAKIGYSPGYGEFYDVFSQSASGSSAHTRVLIMVAVKNGLAAVVEASGTKISPNAQPGVHGTGADLGMIDYYSFFPYWVNSFRWKGDPPR
jgi:hypothetical protein